MHSDGDHTTRTTGPRPRPHTSAGHQPVVRPRRFLWPADLGSFL